MKISLLVSLILVPSLGYAGDPSVALAGGSGGGTNPAKTIDKIIGELDSTELIGGIYSPEISIPVPDEDFKDLLREGLGSKTNSPISWPATTRDGARVTVSLPTDNFESETGTIRVNVDDGILRLENASVLTFSPNTRASAAKLPHSK